VLNYFKILLDPQPSSCEVRIWTFSICMHGLYKGR